MQNTYFVTFLTANVNVRLGLIGETEKVATLIGQFRT